MIFFSRVSTDDEDGMDAADNERRPHFPQFSYSASGREWAPSYCCCLVPFVAILRKTRSHFRKKKKLKKIPVSPLFPPPASLQTGKSLFRDFKEFFAQWDSPTLKNKSPTFSALFTAEGNVFVNLFFSSSVLSLSVRFIFCRFCPFSRSSFWLFCTWFGRAVLGNNKKKTKNVALRVQMFRIIPTGCFFFAGRGISGGFVRVSFCWGKCMARGSLEKKKEKGKKKTKKIVMRRHGSAHSPFPWRRNHCLLLIKKKKKKDWWERMSLYRSLHCGSVVFLALHFLVLYFEGIAQFLGGHMRLVLLYLHNSQ